VLKLKQKKGIVHKLVLVALLLVGGLLWLDLPAYGEDNPFSLSASYSLRDQAQFQAGYQINEQFGVDVGYLDLGPSEFPDSRWQGRLNLKPLKGLDLHAGYDFTGNNYLLGGKAKLPLNDNLNLVSTLEKIIPAEGTGEKYLDYLCGLQIGIGVNHYILAGARGLYQIDAAHEPELFLELDLNWRLPKGFGIRFAPHVGVEGNLSHQTSFSKRWGERLRAEIFVGQEEDQRWDCGLLVSY
jgi:hypothetical protein